MEYKGTLIAFDGYMNLQLFNTEEWVNGECKGNIGEALIRCNNVLYIRDAEGVEEIWKAEYTKKKENDIQLKIVWTQQS